MASLRLVCVAVMLVGAAVADVAFFTPCRGPSQAACTVTEVNITPCLNPETCRFTMGSTSYVSISFKPKFNARQLRWSLYDKDGSSLFHSNACDNTSCPTNDGVEQNFFLNVEPNWLYLSVVGTNNYTWQLWDRFNWTNICCFKIRLGLDM